MIPASKRKLTIRFPKKPTSIDHKPRFRPRIEQRVKAAPIVFPCR